MYAILCMWTVEAFPRFRAKMSAAILDFYEEVISKQILKI